MLFRSWTPPSYVTSVDLLIVGGGGGGGSDAGGGGGGGGVRTVTGLSVVWKSSYPIAVGHGGAGASCPRNSEYNGGGN